MKIKKNEKKAITILAGLSVIIFAIAIFPVNSIFVTVPKSQTNNINAQVPTSALSTGSVINASVVYTKPNQTGTANFLDSIGGGSKFIIQVSSILFDSNQKQFPFQTFLNIPLATQSLVDNQGHNLDLGSLQVSLSGGTDSQAQMIVTGQMQAFLDNTMVADDQFYAQGTAINKIVPITINGQKAFTFTFADEGKTWTDGSTHIFKIMITKVQATVGVGAATQSYSSNMQMLAYLLPMTVNQQKITVLGVDNQAVAIFKSDIQLITSTVGTVTLSGCDGTTVCQQATVGVPSVQVYDNGFLIGQGTNISNIPRNELVTFVINGMPVKIQTPTTVYQYKIDCNFKQTSIYYTPDSNGLQTIAHVIGSPYCTSNFGWQGVPN